MDENDYLAKVSAELITSTAGRAWARNPFKRHRLDLVFRGLKEPYLMTGHIFIAGTNIRIDGRWFRVGVLNRSTAPISDVTVQLIAVDPPGVVHTVPLTLHLMHDNPLQGQSNKETFTVQPGDEPTQFVDVVSMGINQQALQIEHIVPGVLKLYTPGQYTFTLRVSAPYKPPRTRVFIVGLDDVGGLTFQPK
jgi:hypothetical protein